MATTSPMTWNLKWKLTATGAAALAGWFASPLQVAGPASTARTSEPPRAEIQAVSTLEEQTRRLDQHLQAIESTPPTRNLFRFGARPVVRRVLPPPPVVAAVPVVPAPAPFPLRLTGIAVEIVNGVEKRTAILTGPSGVELAANGEPATPGYRVIEVGAGFAVVERASDGARERLTLRP
jgi:hypothetical protein